MTEHIAIPPQVRRVCVSMPETHRYNLIYRQERDTLFSVEPIAGLSFCLLRRPGTSGRFSAKVTARLARTSERGRARTRSSA